MATFATVSVVIGGLACNARCPFCVAAMTPASGLASRAPRFVQAAVGQAAAWARAHGATSAMLTGKGEPTLWPGQVDAALEAIRPAGFAAVDLQTNGLAIADGRVTPARLEGWGQAGLTIVAISTVGISPEDNRAVYAPYRAAYPDLARTVELVHDAGLAVRLAVIAARGYVDSAERFRTVIAFCRRHHVEQLTIRPVNRPAAATGAVASWVESHALTSRAWADIAAVARGGRLLRRLPWGSTIHDLDGQNICLATSLTDDDPDRETGRQLIVLPDGRVSTSWEREATSLAALTGGPVADTGRAA